MGINNGMKHKIPCPQELQQHSMDIRYKTCRRSAVYQVQTQHQTYEDQVGGLQPLHPSTRNKGNSVSSQIENGLTATPSDRYFEYLAFQ